MAPAAQSIVDTRHDQMFPALAPAEVDRLRRFGELRSYRADDCIARTGEIAPGFFVILSGEMAITQRDALGHEQLIVTHGPGHFMGELAQLSGKPALVDATALSDVEAIVVRPQRLRDLLVEEADLGERIMRALILRRVRLIESGSGGPIIVGRSKQGAVLELAAFLGRNGHPLTILDSESDPQAKVLIERFHVAAQDLPIVLCPNGTMLRNPTQDELARCLGMVGALDPSRLYDVAIVGAGPAGLGAAVYAASEGLSVILLDCRSFGGQAGASARIENYLGFPTGITGIALMARAFNQAQKFGAEIVIPDEVSMLGSEDGIFRLSLANREQVRSRAVIIATGAQYKRLAIGNLAEYEGSHVHYWASPLEGRLCTGQDVVLVGGGNSAGQAAVYLATQARKVFMLVRGAGLAATMSRYLIDRISAQPNVELVTHSEVTALKGEDDVLKFVEWTNRSSGAVTTQAIPHVFLFIGADPNTAWLRPCGIALDSKGFVVTGDGHPLQTNRAGVFCIGDVRSGSIKRVAAAVGEGAQVVSALHAYLADGGPIATEKV